MNCRLCSSNIELGSLIGIDRKEYFVCSNCMLINIHPDEFPGLSEEKERYLTHKNGIEHTGYVKFLSTAIDPALKYLNNEMSGLDYGCGYAPTLSKILKQKNIRCEDYDPIFVKKNLYKKYDFIFSTEAFEHFFHPIKEVEKIKSLIKKNGLLIIMTERWKNYEQFCNWYYPGDPTHVSFYHDDTFDYICRNYAFEKLYDDSQRVIILRKL